MFERFEENIFDLIVEPSAGDGSFYHQIKNDNKVGMDIQPGHADITRQDFFTYTPPPNNKNILVIGNPPFGKVSSLAIRFFQHASQWASMIAFIVPRTFRRPSIQNKLDRRFHLVYDMDVPLKPCCFLPPMMVKCCFQIWQKQHTLRNMISLTTSHKDWQFLALGPLDERHQPTPPQHADFVIRAYGGKCGEIVQTGLDTLRPKSWHWIKSNIDKKKLAENFRQLDYTLSTNTARQNSIGRGELVKLYTEMFS